MTIEEFSFSNFWSFKEMQSLNMTAAKIKSKHSALDENNIFLAAEESKQYLLKSKAIYGANSSGKSNVVRALISFIRIVKSSVKDNDSLAMIIPFRLSTETENAPTFFQLIFWLEGVKYRYGFELTNTEILSEWLYATPKKRELPYFIREGNQVIEIDKTNYTEAYKISNFLGDDTENEIFRYNSLFLSSMAAFGFAKLSKKLTDAIRSINVISGLGHGETYNTAMNALDREDNEYIIGLLRYADVAIVDIMVAELQKEGLPQETVVAMKKKFDENDKRVEDTPFLFEVQESEGTQKLFELSPFLNEALRNGTPIIIDEFDARFHPLLTKKIVELFNSKSNNTAQLIFVTHDTNLLSADLLRRDQIDFVEKDQYGASHLYTLVQFKGVRNTASFEKDYINGKYGAIPFLGNFEHLFNTQADAQTN